VLVTYSCNSLLLPEFGILGTLGKSVVIDFLEGRVGKNGWESLRFDY
jgi:hypothetical protein